MQITGLISAQLGEERELQFSPPPVFAARAGRQSWLSGGGSEVANLITIWNWGLKILAQNPSKTMISLPTRVLKMA
jgi:hypothetical protein